MSPSEKEIKEIGEAKLGRKLCEFLKHKKCLVVMDDAWSSLRNDEIALHATNSQAFIHNLGFMDKDESWQLFLKKTFGGRSTMVLCPLELEELGKKIIAQCKGLPLAIAVLGGLSTMEEKTRSSWQKILESIDFHLNQGPKSCMGILVISYNDFPVT